MVEITDILTGEVDDPNKVAALQGAGITSDIIEDLVEANPDKAGILINLN